MSKEDCCSCVIENIQATTTEAAASSWASFLCGDGEDGTTAMMTQKNNNPLLFCATILMVAIAIAIYTAAATRKTATKVVHQKQQEKAQGNINDQEDLKILPHLKEAAETPTISPNSKIKTTTMRVPIVVLRDYSSSTNHRGFQSLLRSVVDGYQTEGSQALKALSQMLEEALLSEKDNGFSPNTYNNPTIGKEFQQQQQLLYSTKLRNRIQKTAECLEHNEHVLRRWMLMQQRHNNNNFVMALPDSQTIENSSEGSAAAALRDKSQERKNFDNDTANGSSTNDNSFSMPLFRRRNNNNINNNINNNGNNATAESSSHHQQQNHQSYDSAIQILAHMVRDWTTKGRPIRHALYDWCLEQMGMIFDTANTTRNSKEEEQQVINVLVPGAGMGRLAYDLYSKKGYNVEANELSLSMVVAASAVMNHHLAIAATAATTANTTTSSQQLQHNYFYPYVLDPMANEVDSNQRFETVKFPDIDLVEEKEEPSSPNRGSLSYTVGDFVGTNQHYYYRQQRAGQFDAIVTCFFIDTATNIYDYIRTIQRLLRKRGVWINVGPVQWHHNALLRPSVDELKEIIEGFGFTITHWSVDTKPLSYRDDDEQPTSISHVVPPPRSTSYDGYRPLRFVARL